MTEAASEQKSIFIGVVGGTPIYFRESPRAVLIGELPLAERQVVLIGKEEDITTEGWICTVIELGKEFSREFNISDVAWFNSHNYLLKVDTIFPTPNSQPNFAFVLRS
ncbi:MAG: hypothetical protein ACM3KR_05205 [Deltaproteobacteria bacterium]